ncbi:hypothetical protein DEO72_LG6g1163 [Vigna unguiculata]|uniref:Uncharacterized protein n=1 Tax=Vigna unguiculata TaxID=3917 RepID=A0A4D6M701_VIGUN|nr:hypothetical protein DEO72_LG6g1163 [Vigna unguiculata]
MSGKVHILLLSCGDTSEVCSYVPCSHLRDVACGSEYLKMSYCNTYRPQSIEHVRETMLRITHRNTRPQPTHSHQQHSPTRATTQQFLVFIRHSEPQLEGCDSEPQLKECHVLNPYPKPQLKECHVLNPYPEPQLLGVALSLGGTLRPVRWYSSPGKTPRFCYTC